MSKRILSFSNPYHLSAKLGQLVIFNKETEDEITRSVEDIGYVIIDHPQVTFTTALMQVLAEFNIAVVFCDAKHHPSSMLLHLDTHHIQAERFKAQVNASEPLKKQLWQQTIKAKILNQAKVLEFAGCRSIALLNLAKRVTSGDTTNCEAQAARIYFKQLFGETFLRYREGPPPNPSLNYGYTILRASVARALVGSGLLVTTGIHHHNKYNSFALADDIMEPFRPFNDWLVHRQIRTIPDYHNLTSERKNEFFQLLHTDCIWNKQMSPLDVAIESVSANLAKCFEGSAKKLQYPELPEP
ncbi:type II CRISPR-associated endonuclease Cas1 [Flavitalea sp. BT771]|uniref:type II CRISPR-associated endonuclease Cas1 n=1 Tax=Flavitalea sp. BT771 TaxID=3063329 RepID=UPI0026E26259|nr:type II CRISPR-associated endonuclease Cas1 [Flavitalea sp. BT771]MDO6433274.1 type II CRISPR-associated endonuclease Cas1 [Flavitalea sp. BT771]MDV6222821.1 type II CRISPR-associated endonuclease Cas1 [Flavitalea sp. BT771]